VTLASQNNLPTRIGPTTAIGTLIRQFWLPTCLASELADGDRLRLMLLSERLIAFRDTAREVGVLDYRYRHWRLSGFRAQRRGGLRCVYHG
jgi:phthalate 4,5-dioxygenase